MFKPAPTALVSLGQPEFTHPNTSLGVYSRNKLLNFTGFFSSFEGAATPAKVAVGADIIWEARCDRGPDQGNRVLLRSFDVG